MPMSSAKSDTLRPTFWRTCRGLASKTRLRIFRELCAHPDQCVSDIAHRLGMSLSLASQSLRALNARGLLLARRFGPSVYYSPCANRSIPNSAPLLRAIQKTFNNDKKPDETIFQYCTAFTHPRRILIIKILSKGPMQFKDIAFKTNIPPRALSRHLRKLIARGFLKRADCRRYICSVPRHEFARFLLHLAKHA